MPDFPDYRMPVPPILTTGHLDSLGTAISPTGGVGFLNLTSAAWTVNNKAYYYPFTVTDHATARQLLFYVGGTSSGNIDVGVYDSQLNLIVSSGSTAMSATVSTVQELNITDTPLAPGEYLLGVACSTTGGTCMRITQPADETTLPSFPVYQQTTALPLPNPCVPVLCTDATVPVWVAGIQFATVF